MVQMSRKSIKPPTRRGCGSSIACLVLLCSLIFGTVVVLTTSISNDHGGTKRRFSLPWMKHEQQEVNGNHIFSKLLSALTESKKNKKKKNKKKKGMKFDSASTMTLKQQDYSHIGGTQASQTKQMNKFSSNNVNILNDKAATEEEKESNDATEAHKDEQKPKATKPNEEVVKKNEEVIKLKGTGVNKGESDDANKGSNKSGDSGNATAGSRTKVEKKKESKKGTGGSGSTRESKKSAPSMKGKVPASSPVTTATKPQKGTKKNSSSGSKQSKKGNGGSGQHTMSNSTETAENRPKGGSTGEGKNSKKVDGKKTDEGGGGKTTTKQ